MINNGKITEEQKQFLNDCLSKVFVSDIFEIKGDGYDSERMLDFVEYHLNEFNIGDKIKITIEKCKEICF